MPFTYEHGTWHQPMLCDVHEHLKIERSVDPKLVREAITGGNSFGLEWTYPGIFAMPDAPESLVRETVDFMEMWSTMEHGYGELSKPDKARVEKEASPLGRDVKFRGFDGNTEGEYGNVAGFLIDHLNRFDEFKGRDLNSHMPLVEAYRRMLSVYKRIRADFVSRAIIADDVIAWLKAMAHPESRKPGT